MAIMTPQEQNPKPKGFWSTLTGGSDLIYNKMPTREMWQEAAQFGSMIPTLGRLATGYQAPDIEPAAAEARRQYFQETQPAIMEKFAQGAGQGDVGRMLQGAGSDLQTKLGALQYEKQHEMNKLRQEALPKMMELGLSSSFQPHLTETTIKNLPKTGAAAAAEIPGALLNMLKTKYPDFYNKYADKLKGFATAGPATPEQKVGRQKAFEQQRSLDQLTRKAKLSPEVSRLLKPEHEPMIKALMKRVRGRKELGQLTDVNDIEALYNFWQKNPSRRSKIGDFLASLVGKKRRK